MTTGGLTAGSAELLAAVAYTHACTQADKIGGHLGAAWVRVKIARHRGKTGVCPHAGHLGAKWVQVPECRCKRDALTTAPSAQVIGEIEHLPREEQARVLEFAFDLARTRQLSGKALSALA